MFSANPDHKVFTTTPSADVWRNGYFANANEAMDLAFKNPEYLGWFKILLGPKVNVSQLESFYETKLLEAEFHLMLMAYNIINQLDNKVIESRVFEAALKSHKELSLDADEVSRVKKYYKSVRYTIIDRQQAHFWTVLNDNLVLTDSEEYQRLHGQRYGWNQIKVTNSNNIGYSYSHLYNKYKSAVAKSIDKVVIINRKNLFEKINKFSNAESKALAEKLYAAWIAKFNNFDAHTKKDENIEYYGKLVNAVIRNFLHKLYNKLTDSPKLQAKVILAHLLNQMLGIRDKINELKNPKTSANEIDRYTYESVTWIRGNQKLVPEQYSNMLPEALVKSIINTGIHYAHPPSVTEPVTNQTLLYKIIQKYNASATDDRVDTIVRILFQHGARYLLTAKPIENSSNEANLQANSANDFISPKHTLDTVGDQLLANAFKKIYKALRDGQSGFFKTNFLAGKENLPADQFLFKVADYVKKNPNSRSAKALKLVQKYSPICPTNNAKLITEIYKESFQASGIFKKSAITGTTFFRSNVFNKKVEQLTYKQFLEAKANTRTGLIMRALR